MMQTNSRIISAIEEGSLDYTDFLTDYARCACGAITVMGGRSNVSFLPKNRQYVAPGLDLRKLHKLNTYCNCNHCVNHWGLDLCACGSGLPPDECDNGFEECGKPFQSFDDDFDI